MKAKVTARKRDNYLSNQHVVALMLTALAASLLLLEGTRAQHTNTFVSKLQRKVSVTWQGQELATALERLANVGQIALWLDRRVDRQQTLTAQIENLALAEAFAQAVEPMSLGVAQLGDVIYIGPEQAALELTALIEQARGQLARAPTRVRRRWLRAEATSWPRLSEPRSLAESWLRDAGVELVGGDQIPHDLWPAVSLPALPLVDRLVLVLVGFDRTCRISRDGKSCEVVAVPRPLKRARQRRGAREEARGLRWSGSRQVFTLQLENQRLGAVLDQFAQQLQLEIVWGVERVEQARQQLVSCDVSNADLDELLQSVLASANLRHRREGKRVMIEVKP